MKALVGAFKEEKTLLVGAFSVIVKTVCKTDGTLHSIALLVSLQIEAPPPAWLVAGSLRSLGWTDRTAGWWFHSLHR